MARLSLATAGGAGGRGMRLFIYGAGAVGQAVGGLLAQAGHHVTMLLRQASADAIARAGLRI